MFIFCLIKAQTWILWVEFDNLFFILYDYDKIFDQRKNISLNFVKLILIVEQLFSRWKRAPFLFSFIDIIFNENISYYKLINESIQISKMKKKSEII